MKLKENNNLTPADQSNEQGVPGGYRVGDDTNLDEKDLKTHYLFGDSEMKDANAPGMEGEGAGGHNFGQNNVTPSRDARPSQNAGYDNEYFNRTQPLEEHPENQNFKSAAEQGAPDYAQANGDNETSKEERESGNTEPQKPNVYQEGTADNDGQGDAQPNVPGPQELPDQQKVGEGDDGAPKDHIET